MSTGKCQTEASDDLNQLKQQLMENLELIALRKFPDKIEQFKQVRKSLSQEITTEKGKEFACTIPVPESLNANLAKLKELPDSISNVVSINPNLQCYQLSRIPVFLKNCQMPTNKEICDLVEKIMPHLTELDQDLNKVDYALRLMLPKMREGEYLGTELLQEVMESVQGMQSVVQSKISDLAMYNNTRYELMQGVISYGHLEDYRLKLAKHDRKFCMDLQRAADYAYKVYVVVYDLVKKNHDKLAEFKQMANLESKEIDNLYF